jgi:hypothetical protein
MFTRTDPNKPFLLFKNLLIQFPDGSHLQPDRSRNRLLRILKNGHAGRLPSPPHLGLANGGTGTIRQHCY